MEKDLDELQPEIDRRTSALRQEAYAILAERPGAQLYANITLINEYRHEYDPGAFGPAIGGAGGPFYQRMTLEGVKISADAINTGEKPLRGGHFEHMGFTNERREVMRSRPIQIDPPISESELDPYRAQKREREQAEAAAWTRAAAEWKKWRWQPR